MSALSYGRPSPSTMLLESSASAGSRTCKLSIASPAPYNCAIERHREHSEITRQRLILTRDADDDVGLRYSAGLTSQLYKRLSVHRRRLKHAVADRRAAAAAARAAARAASHSAVSHDRNRDRALCSETVPVRRCQQYTLRHIDFTTN